jgi:hypothetical protein
MHLVHSAVLLQGTLRINLKPITYRSIGTYDGRRDVEVDYPVAFAKAMMAHKKNEKFRFVHLGGAFTVEDQDKPLWFLEAARKGRVIKFHHRTQSLTDSYRDLANIL